jgi:hypothetical protein
MVTFLMLSSQRIPNQHELHFAAFIPEALKKEKKLPGGLKLFQGLRRAIMSENLGSVRFHNNTTPHKTTIVTYLIQHGLERSRRTVSHDMELFQITLV